jgi:hypothetical protein
MFLFLHTLATNRLARSFMYAGIGFVLVVVYALVHADHQAAPVQNLPSTTAALPACTSSPDTASTQDCISQVFAWCSVHEPTQKASDCATAVLVNGVTKN